MSFFVGSLLIELHIHECHSLKDKRAVLKSIIAKVRDRFNVSITEVGYHDLWQRAELAVAAVAIGRAEADQMLETVIAFVTANLNGDIVSITKEVF